MSAPRASMGVLPSFLSRRQYVCIGLGLAIAAQAAMYSTQQPRLCLPTELLNVLFNLPDALGLYLLHAHVVRAFTGLCTSSKMRRCSRFRLLAALRLT